MSFLKQILLFGKFSTSYPNYSISDRLIYVENDYENFLDDEKYKDLDKYTFDLYICNGELRLVVAESPYDLFQV